MRRESLISPWGIGSIVPFPNDESLMVVGIDSWFDENHDYNDFLIIDERLTKRLSGKVFVLPPDYRKDKSDNNCGIKIPAVRFPLWHYCPACGNMEKAGEASGRTRCNGEERRGKETSCSRKKKNGKKLPYMIPERFVAVCESGHIEDFPVLEWVHRKSGMPITPECRLVRSTGGNSSALSGVKYTCTCGASATMSGAFSKGALDGIDYYCTGNRPWLGSVNSETCGKSLLVLQRGASNIWFANIISSIYIPWMPKYRSQSTKECINKGILIFKSQRVDGEIDKESIASFVSTYKRIFDDVDEEEAVSEIITVLENSGKELTEQTEDEYRKQEFDVLTRDAGKTSEELYVKNYSAREYEKLDFLKSISLVHKLRETRVFLDFRRLSPNTESTADISVDELPWLPAVKNSGEGIMFEFNMDVINSWAEKEDVIARVKIIENNLRASNLLEGEELNPAYVLLHTFSHCLINALANESGYSNASIREKIYCSKYKKNAQTMAGVLIYTASGDSEGSLGGLVRQGANGRIEGVIMRALHEAKWCASDPVCIQSIGQGQDGCNLAACHNCALLPETSCENKNKLLDRGLLIGTLDNENIGFFTSQMDQLDSKVEQK